MLPAPPGGGSRAPWSAPGAAGGAGAAGAGARLPQPRGVRGGPPGVRGPWRCGGARFLALVFAERKPPRSASRRRARSSGCDPGGLRLPVGPGPRLPQPARSPAHPHAHRLCRVCFQALVLPLLSHLPLEIRERCWKPLSSESVHRDSGAEQTGAARCCQAEAEHQTQRGSGKERNTLTATG